MAAAQRVAGATGQRLSKADGTPAAPPLAEARAPDRHARRSMAA